MFKRVYITKGDNLYNDNNVKKDKRMGFLTHDNRLYWIDYNFTEGEEINNTAVGEIFCILKSHRNKLQWAFASEEDSTNRTFCFEPENQVTRLTGHHDDLFNPNSSYMKKSVITPAGSLFWEPHELVTEFKALHKSYMQ